MLFYKSVYEAINIKEHVVYSLYHHVEKLGMQLLLQVLQDVVVLTVGSSIGLCQ